MLRTLSRLLSLSPSAERRYRARDGIVATQQADTTILMDLHSGRYYSLNPVGALVWSAFAGGASVDEVKARVQAEFDAPPEQLARDVEAFVKTLRDAKLVRRDG